MLRPVSSTVTLYRSLQAFTEEEPSFLSTSRTIFIALKHCEMPSKTLWSSQRLVNKQSAPLYLQLTTKKPTRPTFKDCTLIIHQKSPFCYPAASQWSFGRKQLVLRCSYSHVLTRSSLQKAIDKFLRCPDYLGLATIFRNHCNCEVAYHFQS